MQTLIVPLSAPEAADANRFGPKAANLAALGHAVPRPRPRFGHGSEARVGPYVVLGSFHPSQQNTFTGKLTPAMLLAVIDRARWLTGSGPT